MVITVNGTDYTSDQYNSFYLLRENESGFGKEWIYCGALNGRTLTQAVADFEDMSAEDGWKFYQDKEPCIEGGFQC